MTMSARKPLLMPCELVAKNLLPALRAALAVILVREKKLSPYHVSKLLNLTPAAISNYLAGRRGGKYVRELLSDDEVRDMLMQVSELLISNRQEYDSVRRLVCNICKKIRE